MKKILFCFQQVGGVNALLPLIEQLQEKSNAKTSLFSNVSPTGYQYWITAGAGKYGFGLSYVIKLTEARVELYVAGQDAEQNKQRFEKLRLKSNEIEEIFGEPLVVLDGFCD